MASVPKSHGSQQQFNKIPILGLVTEQSATASPPAAPVNGQLWYDTTINRLYIRENGAWVLSSQTGAILSGATAGGDLTGTYPNPTVAALAITDGKVATANKDGAAGTASMRTLGTGALQATAGTDARLSDTRVPTDGSVTGGTAGAGVKIAATTITAANIANAVITDVQVAAANKDGVAGTASMRTLGAGATQALAGTTALSAIAAPVAAVSLAGYKITSLGAPVATDDAARLVDVQNAQAGIDLKPSVRAASTGNVVVASGLVTTTVIDGVTVVTGDRVLLKNQSTASENGVYIVPASGAAARATDVISANSLWLVEEGTVNGDTSWMVTTNNPITTGTTALTLAQFGAGGTTYSGTAARITVTGAVIDIAATYVGQTSLTTLGTISTGTWQGTAVATGYGGTGATTILGARQNLGGGTTTPVAYMVNVAVPALVAGSETLVTHGISCPNGQQAQFFRTSDLYEEELSWRRVSATQIGVTADKAYAGTELTVTVVGG